MTNKNIFIHGNGGFAEELESYLLEKYPSSKIFKVSLTPEPGAISIDDYIKLISVAPEESVNYLGSGKCSIKAKMQHNVIGAIGVSIVLKCSNRSESIGKGSVIADMAVLGFKCVIGESVLVNYAASIGHHTFVGNYCVIAPHAVLGGFCKLGNSVYVGAGAMIREHTVIGTDSTIGMGAIVTKNVPPGSLVIGINNILPQKKPREW